jgi:hypothetical protein
MNARQKAQQIARFILKPSPLVFDEAVNAIEQALQEAAKVEWPHLKDFNSVMQKEQVLLNTQINSGELHEFDDNFSRGAMWAYNYFKSRMSREG